jgi:hypothetical protein
VAEDVEEGGGAECKRSRGLGTGGPDGPVSLNDVRRLQRSNEELRQQLEAHTLATEKLRSDYRASDAVHDVVGVFSHLIHPSSPDSLGTGWSNSVCQILQIWK